MTAKEIYLKAMTMLGYISASGEISGEEEFKKKGICAVNQIYSDLFFALHKTGFCEIRHSDDEIFLPEKALYDIMPYGVAMLIAQNENDGDNQNLYCDIYSKKRASLCTGSYVIDMLPRGCD